MIHILRRNEKVKGEGEKKDIQDVIGDERRIFHFLKNK